MNSTQSLAYSSAADGPPQLHCTTTSYQAFESAVAELRNANRPTSRSGDYLRWRYTTPLCKAGPKVAWLVDGAGRRYGMAAMIPRLYWVDGEKREFCVLGDIALDQSLRGKGLGQKLLAHATQTLAEAGTGEGFVIPTEVARRSLSAAGWVKTDGLVQRVFVIDPSEKIAALTRSTGLGRIVSRCYRALAGSILSIKRRAQVMAQYASLDAQFDRFWHMLPKTGVVIGDRSLASLQWRYAHHPNIEYRPVKFMLADEMLGFAILERDGDAWQIVDILVAEASRVRDCVIALLQFMLRAADSSTVRVTLNEKHPYTNSLRRLGFMQRGAPVPFQCFGMQSSAGLTWMVTQGDKDI